MIHFTKIFLLNVSLMLIFTSSIISQELKCPQLTTDVPIFDWYHQSFDPTFDDTTSLWSQGHDHFYIWRHYHSVTHKGYLYNAYPTFIKYHDVEGALVEKIDITTGELIWQQTFDLRNNDAQEIVAYMHVNDEEHLEIGSYRRIGVPEKSPFFFGFTYSEIDKCVLSIRKYRLEDGQMVSYNYPNPTASGVQHISKRTTVGNIVQSRDDSTYWSLSESRTSLSLDLIDKRNGISLQSSEISKSTESPYDTLKYGIESNFKNLFLGSDTLVRLNMIHGRGDSIDNQATLNIYTNNLTELRKFNIQKHLQGTFRVIHLEHIDHKYITLKVIRSPSSVNEYLIFDWNGNVIQNKQIVIGTQIYAFTVLKPMEVHGEFLIAAIPSMNLAIEFLHLDAAGNLTIRNRVNYIDDKAMTPREILYWEDDTMLMSMSAGYFERNTFNVDCPYITTKIDMQLYTSSHETENVMHTKPYPNPSSGPFTLDISVSSGNADIRIYDMQGRNVYVQHDVTDGVTTIDLSSLIVGTYIYKVFKGSKEIGSGKWVKIN